MWLALVAGLAVSVVLSVGIEVGLYRPLRNRGVSRLRVFVAAFGLLIVLQNLILVVFGSETRPVVIPHLPSALHFGSIVVGTVSAIQFAAAVLMLLAVEATLRWSQLGRSLRGVASNPDTAALIGIDPKRTFVKAYAFGSVLLVPAAFLNSATTGLDPGIGMTLMLTTLIAVIVGGIGSVGGAAIGAWAIGLLQSLSQLVLPLVWQDVVAFGLLLIFILFRPSGLFGRKVWEASV
jgi:branched-chain amino acid transport system permease protein